jgi:hypothetical protein
MLTTAEVPPPLFVTLSVTLMLDPAATVVGVAETVMVKSGPIWTYRGRMLLFSISSVACASSSATAMK